MMPLAMNDSPELHPTRPSWRHNACGASRLCLKKFFARGAKNLLPRLDQCLPMNVFFRFFTLAAIF